jgi:hypothetical protein
VRIIIKCPENILHLEAEYIYADCPFANFKPLAVRRRTIQFQQLTPELWLLQTHQLDRGSFKSNNLCRSGSGFQRGLEPEVAVSVR